MLKKQIHAESQIPTSDNLYRLTWNCNTDSGQCGVVIMVTATERQWLIDHNYVYVNEIDDDPDHVYSFYGDLHPMWEGKASWGYQVLAALEKYRQRQPFPTNLGASV